MKYKKCEKEIGENQKFCKYCGGLINHKKLRLDKSNLNKMQR